MPNLSNAYLRNTILIYADLNDAHLNGANLIRAKLGEVDLRRADLRYADFRYANLNQSNLRFANLSEANFKGAIFDFADLSEANLTKANLSKTSLICTNFRSAKFSETNLLQAKLINVIFSDIDLRTAKGLETVEHVGPSTIGIDTIISSHGDIPEIFLQQAGVPPSIIEQIPALIGSLKPIDYYTCFISYSSKDEDFAKRLYADLQAVRVRCWFAPEDMKIGDRIRPRIDESIRKYDKLLLILSQYSVSSKWVEFEVEVATDKEQEGKPSVLFPVRLDNSVMESTTAWAAHIKRTRHIGDFTHWKNHDDYQRAFTRLLRDLKAST